MEGREHKPCQEDLHSSPEEVQRVVRFLNMDILQQLQQQTPEQLQQQQLQQQSQQQLQQDRQPWITNSGDVSMPVVNLNLRDLSVSQVPCSTNINVSSSTDNQSALNKNFLPIPDQRVEPMTVPMDTGSRLLQTPALNGLPGVGHLGAFMDQSQLLLTQLQGENMVANMQHGTLVTPQRRQRSAKKPIPENEKDALYRQKRERNNTSAKKSRDKKKALEESVLIQLSQVQDVNNKLRELLAYLTQRDQLLDEFGAKWNYIRNGKDYQIHHPHSLQMPPLNLSLDQHMEPVSNIRSVSMIDSAVQNGLEKHTGEQFTETERHVHPSYYHDLDEKFKQHQVRYLIPMHEGLPQEQKKPLQLKMEQFHREQYQRLHEEEPRMQQPQFQQQRQSKLEQHSVVPKVEMGECFKLE